jgi:hypothetical protein
VRISCSGPVVVVDWTDGGAADRLRIVVADTTHPLELRGSLTSIAPAVETRPFAIDAPGPGAYELPFSAVGFGDPTAFASVVSVTLAVLPQIAAPGGSSFALSDVRTVPEPRAAGAAAIASLGLVATSARRRQAPGGPPVM